MSEKKLSKLDFLQGIAVEIPEEKHLVPLLGGWILIRGMSGKERDAWETSLIMGRGRKSKVDTKNLRAKLLVQTMFTLDGERMFLDADAPSLGAVRADILNPLYDCAQRLSGVSDQDLEELEKNSEMNVDG